MARPGWADPGGVLAVRLGSLARGVRSLRSAARGSAGQRGRARLPPARPVRRSWDQRLDATGRQARTAWPPQCATASTWCCLPGPEPPAAVRPPRLQPAPVGRVGSALGRAPGRVRGRAVRAVGAGDSGTPAGLARCSGPPRPLGSLLPCLAFYLSATLSPCSSPGLWGCLSRSLCFSVADSSLSRTPSVTRGPCLSPFRSCPAAGTLSGREVASWEVLPRSGAGLVSAWGMKAGATGTRGTCTRLALSPALGESSQAGPGVWALHFGPGLLGRVGQRLLCGCVVGSLARWRLWQR